jgi:hypothetical protein
MPGPFIFIATNRLREGRFGAEQAGSGVPLSIYPHHLGGFTRTPAG